MEIELGIEELSAPEKSVLFATKEITSQLAGAEMGQILSHPFLSGFSRPTIFRAVANLKAAGLLQKEDGRRGRYFTAE